MNEKIKKVLKLAVLVVEYRGTDTDDCNGSHATTDIDSMINLEAALCDAFDTTSDDATILEIAPKINEL